jgi:hypothetical protein
LRVVLGDPLIEARLSHRREPQSGSATSSIYGLPSGMDHAGTSSSDR